MQFKYMTLSLQQNIDGKKLALFAAPATEVAQWGGIPQKKRFDSGEENAGFQREENSSRVKGIAEFLRNPRNTVQNPLLCSTREASDSFIKFVPLDEESSGFNLGHLEISMPDLGKLTLLELFSRVQSYLETRVPELATRIPSERLVSALLEKAKHEGVTIPDDATESNGATEEDEDGGAAIFDQSHIAEFWEEIAARRIVLEKIGEYTQHTFLGFSREALESYLRPVVIVDGQHRLRGALLAAHNRLGEDDVRSEIERRIDAGENPSTVQSDLLAQHARLLPVSLLLDPDPAEHVFQFVVVNQKATPIGRALLGTIVSTSLTDDELEGVADRLRDAGIPLDESRAASYMARYKDSPFCNCVELGMSNDNANKKLPWAVFVPLVNMFKELKGAVPFHESTDYAAGWKRQHLAESDIVADFAARGFETPFDYWCSNDGPWKDVFICFWTEMRRRFASDDDQRRNHWGNPRRSNLFNKISLNILASDFFKFIRSGRTPINSIQDLQEAIDSWLEGIDPNYFDRDWELEKTGVKKDSPGIRHKWAKTWDEYRASPDRLPICKTYRTPSTL
ncbi:MAG TPA: hypothetical protein VE028_09960 [Nitratidesulfovibrio sp.]|nr:hypothetical protein [Nitratidesulfovibrio sp.]